MSNLTFFDISKKIANDFLQSIVFIDDNAYVDKAGNPHDFDALEIARCFSQSEKFCSIFRPTTKKDIDPIIKVAKKADVVIVDWEMNLIEDDVDDEVSIDDSDVRGTHTKSIIKELLYDPKTGKNSLKLIIIYTGTIDLPSIAKEIKQQIDADRIISLKVLSENNCCLYTENIRIQVVYKGEPESTKFTYNPELKNQEVTITGLPDFVLTEFTILTSGLLSNFALKALTEIRSNSHSILSLFSKELDAAYLAHQAILPNIDDANELLVELFKDIFKDVLRNNQLHQFVDKELIEKWLIKNTEDLSLAFLDKNGNETTKSFNRNNLLLKELLFSEENDVGKRYCKAFRKIESYISLTKEQKEDHLNSLLKNSLLLFKSTNDSNLDEINRRFAMLTHHKNFISPLISLPILSLGTIIESTKGEYYVCIQQRCDSIRIKKERRFLFISLNVVVNACPFDFITPTGVKLKLNNKSFDIRTIKFSDSSGVIKASKEKDTFFFYPTHFTKDPDEKFKWIFELKDLHAQRIVTNYCASLSRVGLDESEWLRLNQR